MTIELTEQQQQAVKNGEAVRIEAAGEAVMILSAAQYDAMKESLEDTQEQRAVLRYSMRQAAKVARENPY